MMKSWMELGNPDRRTYCSTVEEAAEIQGRIDDRIERAIIEERQMFTCIDCKGTGARDGNSENEICVMCEGSGLI